MAEGTKLKISPEDIDNIIKDYATQRKATANITVELSGVNTLDPLFLLKAMSKKEPSVDELAQAAEIMLDGQTITFMNGSKQLYSLAYNRGNGNALHIMFADKIYLYDILQETIYALMLKKLTPHLEGSN